MGLRCPARRSSAAQKEDLRGAYPPASGVAATVQMNETPSGEAADCVTIHQSATILSLEDAMGRKNEQAAERLGAWEQLVQGCKAEDATRGAPIYTPDYPAQNLMLLSSGQVALYL